MRDSKTPVEQPPSLRGTNPPEDLAYLVNNNLHKIPVHLLYNMMRYEKVDFD